MKLIKSKKKESLGGLYQTRVNCARFSFFYILNLIIIYIFII